MSSKQISLLNSPKKSENEYYLLSNNKAKESFGFEDIKQRKTLENFKDVIEKLDNKIYSCPNINVKKYFSQRGLD